MISFVILFFTQCGNPDPVKEETKAVEKTMTVSFSDAQFKNSKIEFGAIEMKTISGTIKASGLLDVPPQSLVSISAPMGGFVKTTDLLQGSKVAKGQVVVVLQHPDYIQMQQDYLENKSQLEFLKAEYERQTELAKENVNSQKTLQQAKANYFSAQAKTEGLKNKLQLLNVNMENLDKGNMQSTITLFSPIAGYVTKVKTNIGAYVNPSDVLFTIVNTESLHAELTIFEKDVPRMKIGQQVLFTLANETKHRNAVVHLIGREISADRTVQVHCEIGNKDKELLPGMYLQAVIETDSSEVTALPEEAIVNFEDKYYIFVLSDKKKSESKNDGELLFEMIEVGTGGNELGYKEVILPENFSHSNKIVVKGAYNILAKMKNTEEL
jgi:cobalt-zinc-cadmium efflux system membrane fusion protein